jgi:hypothetical protein
MEESGEEAPWNHHRERSATTPQTRHEWQRSYAAVGRPGAYVRPSYLRSPPASTTNHRRMTLGVRGIKRRTSIKGRGRYVGKVGGRGERVERDESVRG